MPEIIKIHKDVTDFDVKSGNVLIHYVNQEVWVNDSLMTAGLRGISYTLCADRVFYLTEETRTAMYDIESQTVRIFF